MEILGCDAFQNKPEIASSVYKDIIAEFNGKFSQIEFAVYGSPREGRYYEMFQAMLGK